jgi:CheY-like chemotaxis protein
MHRATYDLIFLDCYMPHLDGFRTAQWIRQREGAERRTPIVAFTASVGASEKCFAAGMDDYVAKPAGESDLTRILTKWIPDASLESGSIDIDRRAIVNIFLGDAPRHVAEIRRALEERNSAAVAEEAHALKSGSGNVGATRLYKLCVDLESIARRGDLDAAQDFSQLEAELRNWRP